MSTGREDGPQLQTDADVGERHGNERKDRGKDEEQRARIIELILGQGTLL